MLPCQIPLMFSTDLFVEFPEFYEHRKDPDLFQGKNRLNVVVFWRENFNHNCPTNQTWDEIHLGRGSSRVEPSKDFLE